MLSKSPRSLQSPPAVPHVPVLCFRRRRVQIGATRHSVVRRATQMPLPCYPCPACVRAVSRLFCAGSLLIAFVSETLARARYVESISGFQQPTPTKQLPSTRFAINEPAQLVWLRDAESSIVPICPCILLSVFYCFMQMLINYCHIYMD